MNPTGGTNMNKLLKGTEYAINKISSKRCQSDCHRVQNLELIYCGKDCIIEEMCESL